MTRGDEERMKFSDSLFLDSDSAEMQQNIEKLIEKSSSSQAERIIKIKKEFMHAVVDRPEFCQTVTELSSYTTEHGSIIDKGQMAKIQSKIKEGSLEYDDVIDLSSIGQKNYKYLFKEAPTGFVFNPTTVIGFALTIIAIIIRCTSDGSTNATSITLLASINLIAIIYTSCMWPKNVIDNLCSWMAANAVPDVISNKLVRPVYKKIWGVSIAFFIFSVLVLVAVSFVKNFALGNDILAIVSLSISVLSDRIVDLLADFFARRIYEDKER